MMGNPRKSDASTSAGVFEVQESPQTAQPTPGQIRIAVGVTATLLFGVVLYHGFCFRSVVHDFTNVYSAAYIVRHGSGSRLYDLYEQAAVQAAIFKWKGLFAYNHPPFEALLLAPLAALSYTGAFVAWGAINIVLWILFVYLIRPYVPIPHQPFQYLILCFTFFPMWFALMEGQTSLVLLLAFALTFVSLKHRCELAAGLFLGLVLLKFSIVLPFALILLLRRKWRLIGGLGLATAILATLSVIAVGFTGVVSYAHLLLDQMRHPATPVYAIKVEDMANVRGLLAELSRGALAAGSVSLAASAVSLCLIAWTVWVWRKHDDDGRGASFDLFFAAALVVAEVSSPHLLIPDVSPVLLAMLLVISSPQMAAKSRWRLVLGLSMAAFYVVPMGIFLLGREAQTGFLSLPLIAFTLGALALAGRPVAAPSLDSAKTEVNPAAAGCVPGVL